MITYLCSGLRDACERAYNYVFSHPSAGSNSPTRCLSKNEYEKLQAAPGSQVEEMDREIAKQLVDLAVSGVEHVPQEKKSGRPGGGTYHKPPGWASKSRSVASESLKELGGPSGDAAREELEVCRQMESDMYKRMNLATTELEAAKLGGPIYLVNKNWFDSWTAFLRGDERPGIISNATVDQSTGELGQQFVGLDAKGWGVLSELYSYDMEITKD